MTASSLGPLAQLPADQRPRERLVRLGSEALTDAELVALLLGTGCRGKSAVDLAAALLREHGGLHGLAVRDAVALAREPGVGAAKAARVRAASEIGHRLANRLPDYATVTSSADLARIAAPLFPCRERERLLVAVWGPGSRLRGCVPVADGGIHGVAVPVREVLAEVLSRDGVAFAVMHNHPSGDPTPSAGDRRVSAALAEAARLCGLRFVDHLVIAGGKWRSAL